MKLLLVEDNQSIIKGLKYSLEVSGYQVDVMNNVTDTAKYLETSTPDLAVLDITLPDGNGFELYSHYLKLKNISAIFLTAKDDEESIVKGLDMGAEDYLTKPFSTKELLARINKILLRNKKTNLITIDDITFDIDKMICLKNNQQVNFTALEIKLLYMLITNLNKTISRASILDKIWDLTGNYVDDHTVTVYFNRIRDKLGNNVIKTVKGIGYRIDYDK